MPVKHARLERKTTRKKVCAERLLANGNISIDEDPSLRIESFPIINLRAWCFHKVKQVYYIHHANAQETYN